MTCRQPRRWRAKLLLFRKEGSCLRKKSNAQVATYPHSVRHLVQLVHKNLLPCAVATAPDTLLWLRRQSAA
jgi:hypothetical protein